MTEEKIISDAAWDHAHAAVNSADPEEDYSEWEGLADHLIEEIPAPSPAAVAVKLRLGLARYEGFEFPDAYRDAIIADLERLEDQFARVWLKQFTALGGSVTLFRGEYSIGWPEYFSSAQRKADEARWPSLCDAGSADRERPSRDMMLADMYHGRARALIDFLDAEPGLLQCVKGLVSRDPAAGIAALLQLEEGA